jgi:hypothetical protein
VAGSEKRWINLVLKRHAIARLGAFVALTPLMIFIHRLALSALARIVLIEVPHMISILVTLLVLCLIFGLIWWILGLIPLPAPFARVAQVVVAVIFLIILIYMLLPFIGTAGVGHPFLR